MEIRDLEIQEAIDLASWHGVIDPLPDHTQTGSNVAAEDLSNRLLLHHAPELANKHEGRARRPMRPRRSEFSPFNVQKPLNN